jgi:hypothetical protein
MVKIAIAGNTSLAYYCAEKLCRNGVPIDLVFLPHKESTDPYDAVDFSPLAGEFKFRQVWLPQTKDIIEMPAIDLLIKLEWPEKIIVPVVPRIAVLDTNLVGQYNQNHFFDIAAELFSGKSELEVQLICPPNGTGLKSVIANSRIAINMFDDVRSLKSKAAAILTEMVHKFSKDINGLMKISSDGLRPHIFKTSIQRNINWHDDVISVHNLIRALTHPGPGAITELDGYRFYIWHGHLYDASDNIYINAQPGTVLEVIEELGVVVLTARGSFLVTRIQPAGAPELPAWVWASEFHVKAGDLFVTEQSAQSKSMSYETFQK